MAAGCRLFIGYSVRPGLRTSRLPRCTCRHCMTGHRHSPPLSRLCVAGQHDEWTEGRYLGLDVLARCRLRPTRADLAIPTVREEVSASIACRPSSLTEPADHALAPSPTNHITWLDLRLTPAEVPTRFPSGAGTARGARRVCFPPAHRSQGASSRRTLVY